MKKIVSLLLCLAMVVTSFAAVVHAEGETGRVVRKWHMEYNGGNKVTYLGLVTSSINQTGSPVQEGLSSGNLIENQIGTAVGIDGSGAASYKSLSYQTKSYMGLMDYQISNQDDYVKPGHTYFKSAMMRLNPDATDNTTKASGLNIWTFHELGTKGFSSDAAGFKAALEAYDGSTSTPNYDWNATKAGTVKSNINTEWVRVTDAMYVDTELASNTRDRAGWVIWGKDWNNEYWTGKWELVVDDYILLEVPNSDMLSVVYPVAYGATIISDGNKAEGGRLTATAEYYDVNPLATPSISYKWQKSTDEKVWTDISGATGSEYTLTADDADADKGISIRVVATASSKNSADETVTYSAYSVPFSVSTESKIVSVQLNSSSFMVDVKAKISAVILREANVTAKNYVWQKSDDGIAWTNIDVPSADEYTVTPEVEGKFIRGGLSITTDEGTSEFTYTDAAKVLGADDEFSFYVDGKTEGSGSFESPYKNLEDARDAARELRANGIENPVVVYIRGGEYYRDTQFTLDDSDKNITFRNYPGEEVLITGGKKVELEDITKVTDEAVLNKIIDPKAKERLYQIDLSEYVDSLEYPYEWSSAISGWDETMFENHLRIVVNGSGLDKSRWPNTTEAELVTSNMSNPNQGIATFRYADSSNRAKLWSEESIANLMIRGHFQHHWTYHLQYATVDPATRTVTTRNATKGAWTNDQGFYFMNLIEEIDMPGESYTDVENKIVYFYGYGDMENPEVYVPASETRLVSILRSKDITFKGIDFAHSKSKLIDGYGMSGLTLDDCSFTHFGARNFLYGDHVNIKNCYWYGNAVAMLDIRDSNTVTYPGDASAVRKMEESGENVIENNKFNLDNTVKLYSSPAVGTALSKEMVVKNNEFYNSAGNALGIGTSIDTLITKNYFHDCVTWTSDMGAIYWNTNSGAFGHEISYNFFENNSSLYGNGWSQSIFYDDCATGPWIHHNVFNQGTLGTSEGGEKYATKGFGGQFAMVENNVFIDTPYGSQFQTWYPFETDGKQTGWWLNMYGKTKDGNTGSGYTEAVWKGNEVLISDSKYAEYYEGTPWEAYFDYVNTEYYNLVKDLDRNEDADELLEIAKQYAPVTTNMFRNNAMVGSMSTTIGVDPTYSNGTEQNTFFAPMSDAESLFTDYENGKFGITDAGLAAITTKATGFEGFELTDIGVQAFESDGATKTVGGNYAEARNAEIKLADGYATPVYDFYDADGEGEGRTTVVWYSSNKADGGYEVVPYGGTYDLPVESLEGKYLKCVISVYDQSGVDGIEAETAPVFVAEKAKAAKAELNTDIAEAEAMADAAVIGTEKGQYTEKNLATFREAIAAVKAVIDDETATVSKVNTAIDDLAKAVTRFINAANKYDSSGTDDDSGSGTPSYPSYGGGSSSGGGGGGGGGSSSSGNKVTYDGTKDNTSPVTPADPGSSDSDVIFTDIIGHWAEKDILSMNEKGIVSGVTESTFEPDRSITRAEFATLVAKALNLEATKSAGFTDVESGAWYEAFVNAAAEAGIIVGNDGCFRPNDLITREEMAVIISKAYDYLEKPEIEGDVSAFTDADEISEWAVQFVGKVTAAGLISGMADGSFAPKANTTRAQAASVLARLLK